MYRGATKACQYLCCCQPRGESRAKAGGLEKQAHSTFFEEGSESTNFVMCLIDNQLSASCRDLQWGRKNYQA